LCDLTTSLEPYVLLISMSFQLFGLQICWL